MPKRVAIIDIGSNSARMIVVERTSRFGFYLIEEAKSKVRIGEGAYEYGGVLQEIPMQRALNALREFKYIAQNLKAKKILTIATSALRDAPNRTLFKSRVKKELGLDINIIDGETEALLGGIAAANLLPIKDGVTVDIGGGSTELALIKDKRVVDTISLNLGTVRLKELFFDKEKDIKKAIAFIQEALEAVPPHFKNDTVVGIGGTIRAISRAIMIKNNYPLDKLHAFTYDVKEEMKFIDKIITSPVTKLKKLNIKKDRYDTIKEGSLIFREVLKLLKAKRVVTSAAGIREGLFLKDLLRNSGYRFPPNFEPSVRSIQDRFCLDRKRCRCIYRYSKKLFGVLSEHFDKERKFERELLLASKLLNVGIKIDFEEHHKHSSYIILNDLNYNVTHQEIVTIATLVRYHKRKLPSKNHLKSFAKLLPDTQIINWLSFILSLAETLNRDLTCPEIDVEFENSMLTIHTPRELYLAKEEIKSLEKPAPFAVILKTSDL